MTTLQISLEMRDQIKKVAERERRSIKQQALLFLERGLEDAEAVNTAKTLAQPVGKGGDK
jgi:hypothetical protein